MRESRLKITNLQLTLIWRIRSWFYLRYLTKEAALEITQLIFNNNKRLGTLEDPQHYLNLLFNINLRSHYRRLKSEERQKIIRSIDETISPQWLAQIERIVNKYSLKVQKKTNLKLNPQQIKNNRKNKHEYHTYELDALWTLDFTLLNKEVYLFYGS